jgi:hypothetical protein
MEVKGDRVEIVIDAGGTTRTYEVAATRAGRRVDVGHGRGIVEVSEVTRNGTPVRTARFMASRVVAVVEYPTDAGPDHPTRAGAGQRSKAAGADQGPAPRSHPRAA